MNSTEIEVRQGIDFARFAEGPLSSIVEATRGFQRDPGSTTLREALGEAAIRAANAGISTADRQLAWYIGTEKAA